jgi:stage II sporulation protein D
MRQILRIQILILVIKALVFSGYSQSIFLDVRLYSNVNIQEAKIMVFSGKYELRQGNEKIEEFYKSAVLTFKGKDSLVEVYHNNKLLVSSTSVTLKGMGFLNTFEIEPVKPSYAKRIYDDNLIIRSMNNNLIIINNVELEHYIAGVVESEGGGSTKDIDFFLVQSITCRTYALANVRKHWNEGFHLCDDVHCQVYKGRCKISYIMMATSQTAGQVIIDDNGKMISAAFHSNSGGQTMNSEDVWTLPTPYLKSVVDTFSLSGRNARWEKQMPVAEWLNFLKNTYNYPVNDSVMKQQALNFRQDKRLVYFPGNIHLKDIRRDLKLKSTFFSVRVVDQDIVLEGRGFGHGVGMSQEGAIRMIQLGLTYEDVIHFYYQNVKIVSFDKLDYFFINYNY